MPIPVTGCITKTLAEREMAGHLCPLESSPNFQLPTRAAIFFTHITTNMPRPTVDYSLYLVTDSGLLPPGRDFAEQVERAIKGGVTLVQLREKKLSTAEFIKRGKYV